MISVSSQAEEAILELSKNLGSIKLEHYVKERSDGPYLVVEVSRPSERLFKALRAAQANLPPENPFKERATVSKRRRSYGDRLAMPEAQLFRSTLSDSLTVDRYTFSDDFFERYTRSVFGFEDQISASANHLVYGRRGSGKSSLLAYAMHSCIAKDSPYAWVDMQTYAGRDDVQVTIDVLQDVLRQCGNRSSDFDQVASARTALDGLAGIQEDAKAEKQLKRLLPRIKQALSSVAEKSGDIFIFLDDLHVLAAEAQSRFLSHIYSAFRGNRCHLKISGIEQFSYPWNSSDNLGLQSPHDAQILKLDYNLTMPDKSRDHIESILDAHAQFSGLPSVSFLCGQGALSRLVWVAGAVPRDALNLFVQAMTKAAARGQKKVSITSINAAASDMAEQKMKDMQQDLRDDSDVQRVLAWIKDFCISKRRKNAFLLEIKNEDPFYGNIQALIALRLVHVIHEGITPHEAGRRYQALLLDYGFYVGIRAAKSVDLFQREPTTPSAKDLRRLPIAAG